MRLHIEFNNSTPPVDYISSEGGALKLPPFEIKIAEGGKNSKQRAIINYLQHFDYAFRCLNNNVDGVIKHMELSDVWFLNQITKNVETSFGDGTAESEQLKYNIIIYDITAGIITEKMYLTRNGAPVKKVYTKADVDKIFSDSYGNVLNNEVIARSPGSEAPVNVLSVIGLTELYIKDYCLRWNSLAKKVQLVTKEGQPITYSGIKEEDVYTFFKLFSLFLDKGKHIGVFYINCANYKAPILRAVLGLIELMYGKSAVVMLYNCDYINREDIPREVINLPNYIIK